MTTSHSRRRVADTAAHLVFTVGLLSRLGAAAFAQETPERTAVLVETPAPHRVLAALSVSLVGLQVYDTYSTLTALQRGGLEVNPMVQGLVASPPAFIAVKAGITGVSIFQAERLWRRNRRGAAIAVLVAGNAVMAVVAAHNASALRSAPAR